jgi:DNA repair protein RadA/Sms
MNKVKTEYFCSNCGAKSTKWIGKCPSCGEWNTYNEEVVYSQKTTKNPSQSSSEALPISADTITLDRRLFLPDSELNKVLGGGLVVGSVVLVGGEPGIGKSTLLLQNMLHTSYHGLYVTGEESRSQVQLRAKRIGIRNEHCFLLPENNLEHVLEQAQKLKPEFMIIDSIQTMESNRLESSPGSVTQVKECTTALIKFAKAYDIPIFIVGHINKDGNIAGPKVLEHMVDVVLQFEGEKNFYYRTLRTFKNRFGSTHEIGLYEMTKDGLEAVQNPSEILISESTDHLSGIAIASAIEGNTPMLVEVQALISTSIYGTPQKNTTGYDMKRLGMLLAVLEKRGGLQLGGKDVFVNIAGGFKPKDTALDLAVCAAIMSSYFDFSIPKHIAFSGEIGLSGEIRPPFRPDSRVFEAEKLGLSQIYLSAFSKIDLGEHSQINVHMVKTIDDLYRLKAATNE